MLGGKIAWRGCGLSNSTSPNARCNRFAIIFFTMLPICLTAQIRVLEFGNGLSSFFLLPVVPPVKLSCPQFCARRTSAARRGGRDRLLCAALPLVYVTLACFVALAGRPLPSHASESKSNAASANSITKSVVVRETALATSSSFAETPACGCPSCLCRDGDQVWLVSSRGICCPDTDVNSLAVWRLDETCHWQQADVATLLAMGGNMPTDIWTHGNWTDSSQAFSLTTQVYRRVACCDNSRGPIRFIAYSWPSTRNGPALQDIRAKAQRPFTVSYLLARFVQRLPDNTPLCLIGFSFGARIACGATHLLAGGELCGRQLEGPVAHHAPLNMVLWGAAMDSCWLAPGQAMGQALAITDKMLSADNPCDRTLEHYRWLYGRHSCATALGYTGPWGLTADYAAKVCTTDICSRKHNTESYLYDDCVMAQTRSYALFEQRGVTATAAKKRLAGK